MHMDIFAHSFVTREKWEIDARIWDRRRWIGNERRDGGDDIERQDSIQRRPRSERVPRMRRSSPAIMPPTNISSAKRILSMNSAPPLSLPSISVLSMLPVAGTSSTAVAGRLVRPPSSGEEGTSVATFNDGLALFLPLVLLLGFSCN